MVEKRNKNTSEGKVTKDQFTSFSVKTVKTGYNTRNTTDHAYIIKNIFPSVGVS